MSKFVPIQSTAGAVPVRNEKGQMIMQKVKVTRYIPGKKPEYAAEEDTDSEDEDFIRQRRERALASRERRESRSESPEFEREESMSGPEIPLDEFSSRRLRRLQQREVEEEVVEDLREAQISRRHRYEEEEEEEEEEEHAGPSSDFRTHRVQEEEEDEEEDDENDIQRRREYARQKAMLRQQQEELLAREEEKLPEEEEEEEEESEYEEYTDSEDDVGERLKPVFVRKRDRLTVAEKEKEQQKQRQMEIEAKRLAEERRRQTLKIVEAEVKKELEGDDEKELQAGILTVHTDTEDEATEYESWKLRELRRIKRDRDEREAIERERQELERIHNMTEEERRLEFKNNPKVVTNKTSKGKYKFLQKYFHRGAFYLDEEDQVYKRDFAEPTLEDHFDKTVLPKVMQVKNFGRRGRTKYTHLVDQDTTQNDAAWAQHTAHNLKFHTQQAGGVKQVFERPALKRKKTE